MRRREEGSHTTWNDLLFKLGERLNQPTLTPATQTRLLGFLNDRHRIALRKAPKLRNGSGQLTTVTGQPKYSLPATVDTVKDVYDPAVNMRKLTNKDLNWVRTADPRAEIISFGPPQSWIDNGYRATINEIATPGALANGTATGNSVWVQSSSASDTGTITMEYLRTGGVPGSTSNTVTGVTPLQLSPTADVTEITKVYASPAPVGFLNLTLANGAGTLLSSLAPGATFARFKSLILWPTPNSNSLVLFYDYVRVIPDAAGNLNDEPLLPLDFHPILIQGALTDEYQKMNDPRYAVASSEWQAGLDELSSSVLNTDDWIVVPNAESVQPYPFHLPMSSDGG